MGRADTHILLVTRHYAPEPVGSAPPFQEMSEWLAHSEGAGKVELITVRPSYPGRNVFEGYRHGERDHGLEGGVQVTRLPTLPMPTGGLFARLGPELIFMLRLWIGRLIGRFQPTFRLVSLCPSILTVVGAMPLKKRGGRHVVVVHDIQSGLGSALGGLATRLVMPALRLLEASILNLVDGVIVLSAEMETELRRIGVKTPIVVQPPMVSARSATPFINSEEAGAQVVMYSGNLGRKQGMFQIIDAAEVLAQRGHHTQFLIRGEGALRKELEDSIHQRNIRNITLEPLAPREELWPSLASASIHLVPQVADGSSSAIPSKIFAIMAVGRPFIATASPGSTLAKLADVSGAFICTPPDDPFALADAIEELVADSEKRLALGHAGRAYALKNADTDVVMHQLSNFILDGQC